MSDKAENTEKTPCAASAVDPLVSFSLQSYEDVKKSIRFKKYSNNVDVNLDINGWHYVHESEKEEGQTAREQAEQYIKFMGIGGDYCYRRTVDGWRLPWIRIYRKN